MPTRYDLLGGTGGYRVAHVILSLGIGSRLYRYLATNANLTPGETVYDVGCGPGMLFPHLLDQVGQQGRVIGIDVSAAMLHKAQRRCERNRWSNVELVRADGYQPAPRGSADVVVFCLCLGAFADPPATLGRWIDHSSPGTRFAILDALTFRELGAPGVSRAYVRFKSYLAGNDCRTPILDVARDGLHKLEVRTPYRGLYTFFTGVV